MPTVTVKMPSGRQERCSKPGACSRHDPHGRVNTGSRSAFLKDVKAKADGTAAVAAKAQPAPIKVNASKLQEPRSGLISYNQVDPYARSWDTYFNLDIDYTDGDDDYYGGTATRIHAVKITEVKDLRAILQQVHGAPTLAAVPQALIDYAKENGLDKPEAYQTEIHEAWDGYYGEEDPDTYSVGLTEESVAKLETWYYNQPNATDAQGVLTYVRAKGVDTTGLTPLDALKKQLVAEHPQLASRLAKANTLQASIVARGDIEFVDEKRLAAATKIKDWATTAYPAADANGMPRNFEGVLYSTRKPGVVFGRRYRLLDGFKRYKSRTTKRTTARYLVLSA